MSNAAAALRCNQFMITPCQPSDSETHQEVPRLQSTRMTDQTQSGLFPDSNPDQTADRCPAPDQAQDGALQPLSQQARERQRSFDLETAGDTVQGPFAEMLAVVG